MEVTDFDPPGPGFWQLDRSHFPGGTTPIARELVGTAVEDVYRREWANIGIPAETLSIKFVNGFWYSRMRPLIFPDRPIGKQPPFILLWLVARLHPEFRRREKAAKRFSEDSQVSEVINAWKEEGRPSLVAKNLDFQDINLQDLDDFALGVHLASLIAHLRETLDEHFRLHCYDLGPIGRFLVEGSDWGIPSHQLLSLLAGASPSTSEPLQALKAISKEVNRSGISPSSLEELAGISDAISDKLDNYLRFHGSVLYAGYDIDSPTLKESPEIILATIRASEKLTTSETHEHETAANSVRSKVPSEDHEHFDVLLSRARVAMDLRDDNGPITAEWPCGLLRLGMLEAGLRLKHVGRIVHEAHIFELTTGELPELVSTKNGPTSDELSERARLRSQQKLLDPPVVLGKIEIPPPVGVLPEHLAAAVNTVQKILAELGMGDGDDPGEQGERTVSGELRGIGIGKSKYKQIARVAENAHEALDRLQPGEILITRTTSPAYNMVLSIAGGLVTVEGGAMCHAAVLSRELNLPAIIGVTGVLEAIDDGALVEVDPEYGCVRVLDRLSGED
jgi:pyruvate,water dikinase